MKWWNSLRWKLAALIAIGCCVVTFASTLGFLWRDRARFLRTTEGDAAAMARIVADQAAPAVLLGDRRAAKDLLASFAADERVDEAVLYDAANACFSQFRRQPGIACPVLPPDGSRLRNSQLVLSQPVRVSSERVGTLVLILQIPSSMILIRQSLDSASLVLVLCLLITVLVALLLQPLVAKPILKMALVAREIAETKQFTARVETTSSDELGILARSFNTMLDELLHRDIALEHHREELEEQVRQRTLELVQSNQELLGAKKRAEEAARLKGQFLANMSHEIRTPMNAILGMTALAMDTPDHEEQMDYLKDVMSSAESLLSLLNEILDLSKIEAGQMELAPVAMSVVESLDRATRFLKTAAAQKNLELAWSTAPEVPDQVLADPLRLRQILLNLLGNAIKFTEKGSVSVDVAVDSQDKSSVCLKFAVRDTGPGIPQEKQDLIFKPFCQADGTTTRKHGGTGLGLTISARFIEMMGGTIWVESQLGRGSTFYFTARMGKIDGKLVPPVPLTADQELLAP